MFRRPTLIATLALVPWLSAAFARADDRPLAHMVFFTLSEDTPDNRAALIALCEKYLTGHAGATYFSAGELAEDLTGDFNDRDFDVALHLVFENKAAQDAYQAHERHLKFVEESKKLWSKVRVFDSYLPGMVADAIPGPAQGFVGLVRGTVVGRGEGRILVKIREVLKVWKPNKAERPETLVGKTIAVVGRPGAEPMRRFLSLLQIGESIEVDVADREGDALTILELNQEQRQRVK
ncbi:MAG: Dabb family protein [Planctomycetes bacterium]|nr:Dabb family protein [Planctomycetota bacterium]